MASLPDRAVSLAFLLLLASACEPGQRDAPPAPSKLVWRMEQSLPHPRSAHAVASSADSIFVLGGSGARCADDAVAPVMEVERFDGRVWSHETDLPGNGLNAPAAVWLNGKLWLIGGFDTLSNVPTNEVWAYDPKQKRWAKAAPLPGARGGHAAVVHEGRVHVLGGGNQFSTLADHSVYEPASDSWSERAPLRRAKGSPAAVSFEGSIWVIGGRSGSSDFAEVERWDARSDAWSGGPSIDARGTAGAVVAWGTILVFGGESQARGECLDSVLRLDSGLAAWEPTTPMPGARSYARAVFLGDAVFVVGGSPSPQPSHAAAGSDSVQSCRADS